MNATWNGLTAGFIAVLAFCGCGTQAKKVEKEPPWNEWSPTYATDPDEPTGFADRYEKLFGRRLEATGNVLLDEKHSNEWEKEKTAFTKEMATIRHGTAYVSVSSVTKTHVIGDAVLNYNPASSSCKVVLWDADTYGKHESGSENKGVHIAIGKGISKEEATELVPGKDAVLLTFDVQAMQIDDSNLLVSIRNITVQSKTPPTDR